MQSITVAALDMQRPNYLTVYAVQGDQLTRWVRAQLTDGGAAWTPPDGSAMTIRYRKPDGTGGWYDQLEDGSAAYSVDGSVLDFAFAAQCLTVPGVVLVELTFWTENAERLSTFAFRLQVEANPITDAEMESSDYYNVLAAQIAAVLGATTHPPQIDPVSKDWMLWDEDTGVYVDSGYSSVGTTGPAPVIVSNVRTWQASANGTTIPTGTWSSSIPAGTPGGYIWSRTVLTYDNGSEVTIYTVAYQGNDGISAPGSQVPLVDQGAGAVGTANAFAREDHRHPAPGVTFQVTLSAAGWANGAQTVSSASFAAIGYAYFVSPDEASKDEFAECKVYAEDVTTDGAMTFHCSAVPESALSVNVCREVVA